MAAFYAVLRNIDWREMNERIYRMVLFVRTYTSLQQDMNERTTALNIISSSKMNFGHSDQFNFFHRSEANEFQLLKGTSARHKNRIKCMVAKIHFHKWISFATKLEFDSLNKIV